MTTALLLGGPSDGRVFPLAEGFRSRILLTQEPLEIGYVGDLTEPASLLGTRNRYEQVLVPSGWPQTKYTIFTYRGTD